MQRRDFLKISAIGGASALMPLSLSASPKAASKKTPANDKINFGFIGLGQQSQGLMNQFIRLPQVRVVAGCDVFDCKRERFLKRATEYYNKQGETKVKIDLYEDYQDLLARPDIDAVVIATPDHQHALIAIAACKAGKDVYLEKPLTLTIYEGQMLCKAVRKYNRVLQVGSMQRSWNEFIHATNIVREGLLGKIEHVKVFVGRNGKFHNTVNAAPVPMSPVLPKDPIPAGLNWDKWLGPLPESVYYSKTLAEPVSDTQKESCWAEWRYVKPTGGGLMTDWGAHMFDIAQWAIGKDCSGPVEVIPPGYGYCNNLTYKYDNGIVMTEEKVPGTGGQATAIYGENGAITVWRGGFLTTNPEFEMKKDVNLAEKSHYQQFVDSIISRNDPNVPVEIGHSSCTVCTLGNIAIDLNRPLKWNPIVQKFMNDPEATALMSYQYRDGYSLEI